MEVSENFLSTTVKIAIVENEAAYRKSILEKLNNLPLVASVSEFSNAEDFWRYEDKESVDLLFLDISMPGLNGLDLVAMLKAREYKMKIIMLTNLTSEDTIVNALKRGAIGYMWKSDLQNIYETVEIVMNGGAMISPTIALKLVQSFKRPVEEISENLSTREKQVLEVLVSGLNCEKAAEIMNISVYTVRTHVKNIYEKLQVNNRASLVKKARELGIG